MLESPICNDAISGLVHTVGATTGSVHEAKVMDNLIREDDRPMYVNRGYANGPELKLAKAAVVRWAV